VIIHRIEFTRPSFTCTSLRVQVGFPGFPYGGPDFEVEVEGDQITRVVKQRKVTLLGFGKSDLETLIYMPDAWTKSFSKQYGAAILKAVNDYKANPPTGELWSYDHEWDGVLSNGVRWKTGRPSGKIPVAWERPIVPL